MTSVGLQSDRFGDGSDRKCRTGRKGKRDSRKRQCLLLGNKKNNSKFATNCFQHSENKAADVKST